MKAHPISYYGVFIFDGNGDVLFSERYKLVEARNINVNIKIPNNSEISQFIKKTVIPYITGASTTNSPIRNNFEISEGIQLVVLGVKNLYLSVIPHIDNKSDSTSPIIEVSSAYSLLAFLDSVLSTSIKSLSGNSTPAAFSHIRQLILQIMPFGTPVIHDTQFALTVVSSGDINRFSGGYPTVASIAVPSWKTSLLFPHPKLELKLKETIIGSFTGPINSNDVSNYLFEVYGEIRCNSSIQYLPDISLDIGNFENAENISSHFCVKSIEGNKVIFSPPSGTCQLIQYKTKLPPTMQGPPIDGVYKIKEDSSGLNFSLTINSHMSLKKVTIQLPFPGRGGIVKPQFQSPCGQLKMSKKEATIMWVVELEENSSFTLTGSMNFDVKNRAIPGEKYFAYVSFDNKKNTFSGISIDKDSVASNASQNLNVTVESSYATESKKYTIWESPFE